MAASSGSGRSANGGSTDASRCAAAAARCRPAGGNGGGAKADTYSVCSWGARWPVHVGRASRLPMLHCGRTFYIAVRLSSPLNPTCAAVVRGSDLAPDTE